MRKTILTIALVAGAVACGDSNGNGGDDPVDIGEGILFADKTFEQRAAYMQVVVAPTMAPLFQDAFPGQYDNFNCATCHGSGAGDGTFTMPSGDLATLDFANFPPATPSGPEFATFMQTVVVPRMADLLDEEPFDPQTNQGTFGCTDCHNLL